MVVDGPAHRERVLEIHDGNRVKFYSNGCEHCGSHLSDWQLQELGEVLCCDFPTHDSVLGMTVESDRELPCIADVRQLKIGS